jgi:hypothetical protein
MCDFLLIKNKSHMDMLILFLQYSGFLKINFLNSKKYFFEYIRKIKAYGLPLCKHAVFKSQYHFVVVTKQRYTHILNIILNPGMMIVL